MLRSQVLDFSSQGCKEGRDGGGSHVPPQRHRGRPSHRQRGLHRRAAEAGWRPLSIGDWRPSTIASPGPTEAAPRAAPARTVCLDRMGPSAPPHRVSGGRGGAARHHLAAEPGLGKSPSGPIYSFPKFNAGLVYFSLRGPRETGARSYRVKLYPSDWSGGQRVATTRSSSRPGPWVACPWRGPRWWQGWAAAASRWSWWTQVRDPNVRVSGKPEQEEHRALDYTGRCCRRHSIQWFLSSRPSKSVSFVAANIK